MRRGAGGGTVRSTPTPDGGRYDRAFVSGAAQLIVTLRRRAQFGSQWPPLLAETFSMVAGIDYLIAAARDSPMLTSLVIYTTGGIELAGLASSGTCSPMAKQVSGPDR